MSYEACRVVVAVTQGGWHLGIFYLSLFIYVCVCVCGLVFDSSNDVGRLITM